MHLIHRGIVNKNYKENLLNSFKASFKKGYGIETDIHTTKDGHFVCFHDFTLKRIHKINKSIKNINYFDLVNLTKKNQIPLLKDLLKLSKNKFKLFIEIKPLMTNKLLRKLKKSIINLLLLLSKILGPSIELETELGHLSVITVIPNSFLITW